MQKTVRKSVSLLAVCLLLIASLLGVVISTHAEETETNLLLMDGVVYSEKGFIGGNLNVMFDGNRGTADSMVSNNGEDPYLQADLGGVYQIERWVVANWGDLGASFLNAHYSLQISNDGTTFTKVAEWDNIADTQTTTDLELAEPVQAQYVRLVFHRGSNGKYTVNADDQVRMYDWELYGGEVPEEETPEDVNLLLEDGVVYGEKGFIGGNLNVMFDGNRGTADSMVSNNGEDPYLQADLGGVYQIKRWVVANWGDLGASFLNAHYSLQISNDGTTFTKVAEWDNIADTQTTTDLELAEPVQAQYVRLVFHRGSNGKYTVNADDQVRMYDWELYGCAASDEETPEESVNLLLEDGVVYGENGFIGGNLNVMFDGNRGTADSMVSNNGEDPYLQADLGSVKKIARWVVANWGDLGASFLNAHYSLQISNDGTTFTKVAEWDNIADTQTVTDLNLAEPVEARYVRLVFHKGSNGKYTVNADDQVRMYDWELYNVTSPDAVTPDAGEDDGADEGDTCEHSWNDATCSAPKTCELCGETEGEALKHNNVNGKCSVCGKNINLLLGTEEYISFGKGAGLASSAVDGNYDGAGVTIDQDDDWVHWLKVELPEKITFDHTVVHLYAGDGKGFIVKNFDIQISEDGAVWNTVANINNWADKAAVVEATFEPVAAQYIRLKFNWVDENGNVTDDYSGEIGGDPFARVMEWELFNESGADLSNPGTDDEGNKPGDDEGNKPGDDEGNKPGTDEDKSPETGVESVLGIAVLFAIISAGVLTVSYSRKKQTI